MLIVTGSVQIRMKHFPPTAKRKVHGISVTILQARDLTKIATENMAPYIVLHLLPDSEAMTTQNTNVQLKSTNPLYNETFYLYLIINTVPLTKEKSRNFTWESGIMTKKEESRNLWGSALFQFHR